MKKILILSAIVLVLVVVLISKSQNSNSTQKSTENIQNIQPTPTQNKYKTQINSEGEVTVEVTPISLSKDSNAQFRVTLNTHSVALDKDLKDISVLTDNEGNVYSPISWSGGTGGHHLEGILTFPSLSANAKSVKLTINGIADIDRVFDWRVF